jgi:hypothetical protein
MKREAAWRCGDISNECEISSLPSRERPQDAKSPAGREALLMRSVKSAFALLLTKVTKLRLRRKRKIETESGVNI